MRHHKTEREWDIITDQKYKMKTETRNEIL
jgi:hypothetical protein